MMTRALLLVLIAACEFQPAPPAPPPSAPGSAVAPAAAKPVVVVADAAPAPAPTPVADPIADAGVAVTAECLATGAHIADVLIAGTTDTSLKASYEQARDRIVRTAGEACTTQSWTADAQGCFMQSKQQADLEACEKKFPTRGR